MESANTETRALPDAQEVRGLLISAEYWSLNTFGSTISFFDGSCGVNGLCMVMRDSQRAMPAGGGEGGLSSLFYIFCSIFRIRKSFGSYSLFMSHNLCLCSMVLITFQFKPSVLSDAIFSEWRTWLGKVRIGFVLNLDGDLVSCHSLACL